MATLKGVNSRAVKTYYLWNVIALYLNKILHYKKVLNVVTKIFRSEDIM